MTTRLPTPEYGRAARKAVFGIEWPNTITSADFDLIVDVLIPRIALALEDEAAAARRDALKEAALVAEAEPELEGDPPAEQLEIMRANPVLSARAACRATKKAIASRILALSNVPAEQEGEKPWRVGRRVGRNIYRNDRPVCMVESDELAAEMVRALNAGQSAAPRSTAVEELVRAAEGFLNAPLSMQDNVLWVERYNRLAAALSALRAQSEGVTDGTR
jgi:hypothetical protein